MLLNGWPVNGADYSNTLLYQHNNSVKTYDLPPEHPALELFELDFAHPGFPGMGVRVSKEQMIRKGSILGYYAGVYRPAAFAADNPFVFDTANEYVVDAQDRGNLMRFVNDPRGTGCEPNVDTELMEMTVNRQTLRTIVYKAQRDVMAGEELVLDYCVMGEYWKAHAPAEDRIRHVDAIKARWLFGRTYVLLARTFQFRGPSVVADAAPRFLVNVTLPTQTYPLVKRVYRELEIAYILRGAAIDDVGCHFVNVDDFQKVLHHADNIFDLSRDDIDRVSAMLDVRTAPEIWKDVPQYSLPKRDLQALFVRHKLPIVNHQPPVSAAETPPPLPVADEDSIELSSSSLESKANDENVIVPTRLATRYMSTRPSRRAARRARRCFEQSVQRKRKRWPLKYRKWEIVRYQERLYVITDVDALSYTYTLQLLGSDTVKNTVEENNILELNGGLGALNDNDLNWLAEKFKGVFTPRYDAIYGVRKSLARIEEETIEIRGFLSDSRERNQVEMRDSLEEVCTFFRNVVNANDSETLRKLNGEIDVFTKECLRVVLITKCVATVTEKETTSSGKHSYWQQEYGNLFNFKWQRAKNLAEVGSLLLRFPRISMTQCTTMSRLVELRTTIRLLLVGNHEALRPRFQNPDKDLLTLVNDTTLPEVHKLIAAVDGLVGYRQLVE